MEFPPFYTNPLAINNHLNFLNLEEIERLEKDIHDLPYEKSGTGTNSLNLKSIRNSQIKWLPNNLEKFNWIYARLFNQIHHDNSELWRFDLGKSSPKIQYTEYNGKEQGHYDWHTDTGPTYASHRKISITLQLSNPEDYDGGFLQLFNFQNLPPEHLHNISNVPDYIKTIKKQKGSLTIFPSFIPHKITPITKGTRKSLVLWVGGTPFK